MTNPIAHTSTRKKASKAKLLASKTKTGNIAPVASRTIKTTAKAVKISAKTGGSRSLAGQVLSRQQLLLDMDSYRKDVIATPNSARKFLTRLGVMTSDGRSKKLIRG